MRRTLLVLIIVASQIAFAQTRLRTASAPSLPQPAGRNVIVQLFNWKFTEITAALPKLHAIGYSHIHVSPPQKSNERVWQWWGRYQPIDFSVIAGPLGSEAEFRKMNAE